MRRNTGMSKNNLVIQHDLSKLSPEQLAQYLRDVSTYIGLDPDLNALDTIWMVNENGPGQSLVVYARRGTAEILRSSLKIKVLSLTNQMVRDSIVFTASGENAVGRQEVAVGSKSIANLTGKGLDDAIMTASTRALRRLTMQFTSLGILDESEVRASVGDTTNLASGAELASGPMVIPPMPSVVPNNAPGRDITPAPTDTKSPSFAEEQQALRDDAKKQLEKSTEEPTPAPAESSSLKPKRARRPRNTVTMDGPEPEVVSSPAPATEVAPQAAPAPPAIPVAPTSVAPPALAPAPVSALPTTVDGHFEGKPTEAQMAEYRKRISVFTAELPSSENMGSVQKMRAFITRMSDPPTPPQYMTVDQWNDVLAWFDAFMVNNSTKNLVKYINDFLGVK
jgi:hypothetical protein